jgi:hypothetical protein
VAASVKWPPEALFLVVETIKPARANNAIDKMTNATSISIKVKPFLFLEGFKVQSPEGDFDFRYCKTYTNASPSLTLKPKWIRA